MIQNLKTYSVGIAIAATETFQFNCNILNAIILKAEDKPSLQVSVRSGQSQLISNVSVQGLEAILAGITKNQSTSTFVPFGSFPAVGQTITLSLNNTNAGVKKCSLSVVYNEKGKGGVNSYSSFTDNNFSAGNVIGLAHADGSALGTSAETVTWNHGNKSESQTLATYNDLYNSQVTTTDTKNALIFRGAPGQLDCKSTIAYTSTDQTVIMQKIM